MESNGADYSTGFYSDDQMIVIPEGDIIQRDDRIHTKWKTHVDSFLLAKYPVTVDLFFQVTKKEPYSFGGDQRPVVNVSWNDAVLFCILLSREAGLKECYSILSDDGNVALKNPRWKKSGRTAARNHPSARRISRTICRLKKSSMFSLLRKEDVRTVIKNWSSSGKENGKHSRLFLRRPLSSVTSSMCTAAETARRTAALPRLSVRP